MGQKEVMAGEENNNHSREENGCETTDAKPDLKSDYVRIKMEEMQKRIDELKEKVKSEGDFLHKEEYSLHSDNLDDKFEDSLSDLTNQMGSLEHEDTSEKSLYFSASNYSLCSFSTSSSESGYFSFSKFVNNFVKNQNQEERVSLLRLHSNKQISLNMLKHSLTDLDSRCSQELDLVEKSLEHLGKLAAEYSVSVPAGQDGDAPKALEFHTSGDAESNNWKTRIPEIFDWPSSKVNSGKMSSM